MCDVQEVLLLQDSDDHVHQQIKDYTMVSAFPVSELDDITDTPSAVKVGVSW